jgi:NAD(P)-dependent dehydrogenase (short-subunit alcohol dehydrogenase family)
LKQSNIAIVTGAQQGIGAAAAIALAQAGYDIVANYLDDESSTNALVQQIEGAGRKAFAVKANVTDENDLERLFDTASQAGRVSALVNNAAIFPRVDFLEMSGADWDGVIGVNLRAVFRCTQRAAHIMVANKTKGAVVNLTSGAAYRGSPRGAHYVTSKAGIVGFTRAVSQELAPHGIRVNAVAPGLTDTAQPRFGMSEEEIDTAAGAVPLGRIATASDIADSIQFLCSDKARHITGQIIHVNGGQYLG